MVIKVDLDKNLEQSFRQTAMKRFGYSKGSIKKAAEAAIKKWTIEEGEAAQSVQNERRQKGNPVDLIGGGLAHLKGKKTSLELQHESKIVWQAK
jgi:hypothetical protein